MNTTNLPTLTAVNAQPRRAAVLSLSSGRRVTVATADRVIFAPEPGVLIVHGKGYAVPAALFAGLRAALKLEGQRPALMEESSSYSLTGAAQ